MVITSAVLYRASDKCQREKRKTINGDDLVWAMSILGFEEYGEPLKLYLHKYREVSCLTGRWCFAKWCLACYVTSLQQRMSRRCIW